MKISRPGCGGWAKIGTAALVLLVVIGGTANGQRAPAAGSDKSTMHQHYDAAYRYQASGEFARADVEHMRFLVAALDHIADGYANTGDYAHAALTYEEALTLAPADFGLLIDYAGASLDAHDPRKAKSLLQAAMDLDPKGMTDQQKAQVRRMLGRSLRALGDTKASIEQFQAAIALDPGIESQCDLGEAVLELEGHAAAGAIFQKVVSRFGDTAAVRMRIGRIYALGGFPEGAIQEFKQAVARDYQMPGVHYSLGAAYMGYSESSFPQAEAEFRKELALHPNDTFSYPQLGHIALRRRDYHEAEIDFKHTQALNPRDADNLMDLGKLYIETARPSEAEAAFRQAIALTVDPSRNYYAIERAHYQLGRLLLASGNTSEGERELHLSEELLSQSELQDESTLSGQPVTRSPLERTRVATPEEAEELKTFAQQVGPLIAGSYNNLGVHAALRGEFAQAAGQFQLAAKWNPTLPGVDSNWARAAFAAHECAQAIGPLGRSLAAHASDHEVRAMLDQCQGTLSITPKP
jgi:tetratricopeptide (TPR) repeat protein